MGNAETLRDTARVVDILTGTAGALAMRGGTVIVKLKCHANDVIPFLLQKRCDNRGIYAA